MDRKLTVDDYIQKKKTQMNKIQMKYIFAQVRRRIYTCPDTLCSNNLCTQKLVDHILEMHEDVPKYIVELDQYSGIEVNLHDLDHENSDCILVLFISVSSTSVRDVVSDKTTMPLMVMAAKINSSEQLMSSELQDEPHSPDKHLLNPGEQLMVWVCGHLPSLSTIIKAKTIVDDLANVHVGKVHSIAENNFDPKVVFSRGNCFVISADIVKQVTARGKNPLSVEIQVSV